VIDLEILFIEQQGKLTKLYIQFAVNTLANPGFPLCSGGGGDWDWDWD
jgi:hypothetical protein